MIRPSNLDSFLISFGNRKSRLAIRSCCTNKLQVVSRTERPCWISCSPNAHRQWLFPEPGLPNSSRFSRRG